MKQGQKLWTRDELILALKLYYTVEFGQIHRFNPKVIDLAKLLDRTPSSVALKLANLASFDPELKARGIKGVSNASKLDRQLWEEFFSQKELLSYEAIGLRARLERTSIERLIQIPEEELPKEGKVREQWIKTRVNQAFFRSMVLAAYNNTCCITGLNQPELLVAGHIRPWGLDEKNRMNPKNGLALNALHDRAFETGLITITPDYIVKVSPSVLKQKDSATFDLLGKYENKKIILPSRDLPNPEFLKYHNQERFYI